jgi:hypothetical protein
MAELPQRPSVLVLGVDPARLDAAEWPVTQEETATVTAAIARGRAEIETAGYDVEMCLVALDPQLVSVISHALATRAWDCVLVGGGLRKPPELLETFERLVNLVHRMAPQAVIAFNERPDDLLSAIDRAMSSTTKEPA